MAWQGRDMSLRARGSLQARRFTGLQLTDSDRHGIIAAISPCCGASSAFSRAHFAFPKCHLSTNVTAADRLVDLYLPKVHTYEDSVVPTYSSATLPSSRLWLEPQAPGISMPRRRVSSLTPDAFTLPASRLKPHASSFKPRADMLAKSKQRQKQTASGQIIHGSPSLAIHSPSKSIPLTPPFAAILTSPATTCRMPSFQLEYVRVLHLQLISINHYCTVQYLNHIINTRASSPAVHQRSSTGERQAYSYYKYYSDHEFLTPWTVASRQLNQNHADPPSRRPVASLIP
ncbi:uncharacterized protein TRIREDRAFT_103286 [Trichoderma reesei QM6a]|uniref:Predicted protein n=2 Tax=Hypocrea jecorina TaxID=51453 RepID=G0R7H1_HYPJQ|nr:uncharacterized protein TRIREDRAFT_103286 [Trichoderma reesei QM6a]EGR53096.1 predicted protein [Trichoderma reesei QM6a]ETR99973.1 hypothetical protein M419DRAFT_132034 [Trichoderma reesei RUT C-30]